MASGHPSSRPSLCTARLVLTAVAALGAMTGGEAHADERAAAGAPAPVHAFVAPANTSMAPVHALVAPRTPAVAEPFVTVPGPSGSPSHVTPSATPSAPPPGAPSAPHRPGTSTGPSAAPAPPAPLPSAPSGAPSDDAGPPSPSAGSPRSQDKQSPLAGRPAGEGRERPGRQLTPQEIAQADDAAESNKNDPTATIPTPTDPAAVPVTVPDASTSPEAGRYSRQAVGEGAVGQVQELSLGVGISLVGLGIGFLAMRIRRLG
ncbi:hypothetical protein [Streptomyces brevispora]|uniref:hypothetical protein n=1 Tax=Streptomyces brevispora TaxID=887462 RepID=UPI00381F033B